MFFSELTYQGREISASLGSRYVRIDHWTKDFLSYVFQRVGSYENSSILCSIMNDLKNGTFASGSDLEGSEQIVGIRDFSLTPWRVQITFDCGRKTKNKEGRSYPRPFTFGTPVVVIAAMTSCKKLLLVKQYRIGSGWTWEIPRGMCGEQESPEDAAIRETNEELGIHLQAQANRLQRIGQLSTGIAPYIRPHLCYLIQNVALDEISPIKKSAEGIIKVQALSLSEIRDLFMNGSLSDPCILSVLQLVDWQN